MVMFHIKLKGLKHKTTCSQMFSLTHTFDPLGGVNICKLIVFSYDQNDTKDRLCGFKMFKTEFNPITVCEFSFHCMTVTC